ncbi:MAG TPA: D-alanyl-D-alanine carboxypeptidase/D-alanyl-D-alanine-endopeptidase [Burkholderiaceae bacterium]|nr:D-alanyl-D-alanine carboxypeptidase/D-alanyl-D-alanine-endopeptidase [Burkholderiaceae bacterium]
MTNNRQKTCSQIPLSFLWPLFYQAQSKSLARVLWRVAFLFSLALGLVFTQVAAAAPTWPGQLEQSWKQTRLPSSALSLLIKELDGPTLVDVNSQAVRNPASVMKLVTTWVALSDLGPAYRWRTSFFAAPGSHIDAQGSLTGPLYIKTTGDPFLTVPELWDLLRQLRLRGVKNLSEVLIDRSVFGNVAINTFDFDGAGDRPYNASPDALMVGLGAVRLLFQPDPKAKKWVPIIDPPLRGVRVSGDVAWAEGRCPGPPAVATRAVQHEGNVVVEVDGTVVGSCGEFSLYRVIQPQPNHFEAVFRLLWQELGGTLGKGFGVANLPAGAQELVHADSRSLAEIVRRINKLSNNVMARMVLLTLGAEAMGPGATPESGARVALASLSSQGVDTQGWVLENGSGLSRIERLTAVGLAQMLEVAWRSPLMPEFMSSLAIPGVDGTMRRRLRNDSARGVAHLKTGSLRDVRAVAGYVLGASGKRYLVVVLVNHENPGNVRAFFDEVIRWTAAQ